MISNCSSCRPSKKRLASGWPPWRPGATSWPSTPMSPEAALCSPIRPKWPRPRVLDCSLRWASSGSDPGCCDCLAPRSTSQALRSSQRARSHPRHAVPRRRAELQRGTHPFAAPGARRPEQRLGRVIPVRRRRNCPPATRRRRPQRRAGFQVGGGRVRRHADGRSVVVANTAFAAARSGTRVLVVDADFGNQSLTEILVGSAPPLMGLTDVAAGSVPLSDAVVRVSRTETESVSLLTRGTLDVRGSGLLCVSRHRSLARRNHQALRPRADRRLPPLLRVAYSAPSSDWPIGTGRRAPRLRHAGGTEELRHQLDLIDTPLLGYVYN